LALSVQVERRRLTIQNGRRRSNIDVSPPVHPGAKGTRAPAALAILAAMKLYFAGPLFTTTERVWNAEVTTALRAAGHEVFLPQEQEPGKDGRASSPSMSEGSTGPMG
jgi:hypothetical protein